MAVECCNGLRPSSWNKSCHLSAFVWQSKFLHTRIESSTYGTTATTTIYSFYVQDISIWTPSVHKTAEKLQLGTGKIIYRSKQWLWWQRGSLWEELFSPVHSLYVVQIVVLQLFPLQLERICDETCLGGPRLRTQMYLHWDLKSLEFNCKDEKNRGRKQWCSSIGQWIMVLTNKIVVCSMHGIWRDLEGQFNAF